MACRERSGETACFSAFDLSAIAIKLLALKNQIKIAPYSAKSLGLDSSPCR